MFDIGFWELMIIGIMGLVILGPERLPVAIRTIRGWIGGVRKFSDAVKTELTEELRINELHANLKKAEQADMKNLSPEVAESLKSLQEATDMVTEPFKKVDTEPLDSMISSSLAASSKTQTSNEASDVEHSADNEKIEQPIKAVAQVESTEKPK
ncbi:Sec-independent protein translocase protein TatB [Litorilituus lipolyticus]|uniref:Sec-independent protein translocase protein TatB n=1 Tax=Litorilituus lipolyticus TaxID=2491017 RepID=A0A502L147_9GAMM|nr:Sec-independent protein translocase protein TatB [Litorilituus lipolyticus]TPH15693.1 Sec-independent protein translocase subunit TatB [Litorilituus lipolyticus]